MTTQDTEIMQTEQEPMQQPAVEAEPEQVTQPIQQPQPKRVANSRLSRFAQIISDIFSPILIPTYCMILAMWITPLNVLPERTRVNAVIGIAFITAVMPAAFLFTLIRMHKVSDTSVSNRKERTVPYIAAIVCYVLAAYYLCFIHAPEWLVLFYVGAGIATTIALIITFKWKISAHTIGAGGMIGMLGWLTYNSMSSGLAAMIWLSVAIALAGLIGTTRIILNRHTPAQVYVGAIIGIATVIGTMCVASLCIS